MNYNIPPRICFACMREYDNTNNTCPHCGYVLGTPQEDEVMLAQGTVLQGKYLIGKAIGRGGFGITYVGYNMILKEKIAIKEFFPKEYASRDDSDNITVVKSNDGNIYNKCLKKFISEAQTLAKFNSSTGIVSIHDCFEENGTAYIIMEYLDGMTLRELKEKTGTLSFDFVKKILFEACDILSFIHSKNITHRDISPDNIFYCKDGSIKFIDFGAVKELLVSQKSSSLIMVKHGFTPIEQYSHSCNVDKRSDIYSLGATTYYLLTNTVPQNAADRIQEDKVISVSEIRGDVPQYFNATIMKAIAINARDRFSGVEEFKKALYSNSQFTIPLKSDEQSTILPNEGGTRKEKRSALFIAVATLIIIIIVIGACLFYSWESKKQNNNNSSEQKNSVSNEEGIDEETVIGSDIIISDQPEDTTITEGEKAFFQVIAKGEKLSYQWQLSKDNGETWNDSALNYSETDKLMVEGESHRDGYLFRCRISNKEGKEVFTKAAALTIVSNEPTAISTPISIAVSESDTTVKMPDCLNKKADIVQQELKNLEVNTKLEYSFNNNILKGYIISQSIMAGATINKGETVVLTVSKGEDICPYEYSQKLTVTASADATKGTAVLYVWSEGDWKEQASYVCSLGSNGIGPAEEGSSRTPEGIHNLGIVLSIYAPVTNMSVYAVTADTGVVNDTDSSLYNMIFENTPDGVDRSNFDKIGIDLTNGTTYATIYIEHNGTGFSSKNVVKGKGSAIGIRGQFGSLSETYGDVDISADDMKDLLGRLDYYKKPVIEIMVK